MLPARKSSEFSSMPAEEHTIEYHVLRSEVGKFADRYRRKYSPPEVRTNIGRESHAQTVLVHRQPPGARPDTMHTSWTLFVLFWAGVGLGIGAQICSYRSTPRPRPRLRVWGLWLGILGTVIAGGTAFKAAVDWKTAPLSPDGLGPGEQYDNGGSLAVVESPDRLARIKQINEQSHQSQLTAPTAPSPSRQRLSHPTGTRTTNRKFRRSTHSRIRCHSRCHRRIFPDRCEGLGKVASFRTEARGSV
jgi:hypothetical protein